MSVTGSTVSSFIVTAPFSAGRNGAEPLSLILKAGLALTCAIVPAPSRNGRYPFNKQRAKRPRLRFADSIGIDLLPFKALAQRGKGGVYQAADLLVSPARLVIMKEGLRHGETDWLGQDGFRRSQHEGRVLRSLLRAVCRFPSRFVNSRSVATVISCSKRSPDDLCCRGTALNRRGLHGNTR